MKASNKPRIISRSAGTVNVSVLASLGLTRLKELYREVFGEALTVGNAEHARRQIARRLQEKQEGPLPESVRQHALAIARNISTSYRGRRAREGPRVSSRIHADHDSRTPLPGTVLIKELRGRRFVVHVLPAGYEWEGKRFASLSAVAKAITGTKWNGFAFFGLQKERANGRS